MTSTASSPLTPALDATHHPAARSWVLSANEPDTDFPIQNLPLGLFQRPGDAPSHWRPGTAIGDQVVDLCAAAQAGLLPESLGLLLQTCATQGALNPLMAQGAAARQALRLALFAALEDRGEAAPSAAQAAWAACLQPASAVVMGLPCRIGDYTDFYTGIHHATTVGSLFRPDNPLLPNYKWVPIGYHGRASSVVVSGQAFHRPMGQLKGPQDEVPRFAPSERLDYELEMGVLIGPGNRMGQPISMDDAESHWWGLVLLNDWSARDIQAWEYQPLGPFLSKNFATTLSPWVVTPEALAPFRQPFTRPAGDPAPLPYLDSAAHRAHGHVDVQLEVWLQTPAMREAGQPHHRLMGSNFSDAYWTLSQLIAHHTANGCNLAPGDLLGTGTLSGPQPEQGGSMLELSQGGKLDLRLPSGEIRRFLQDGDSVMLRARCERAGARAIGFGACEGTVLPAGLPGMSSV